MKLGAVLGGWTYVFSLFWFRLLECVMLVTVCVQYRVVMSSNTVAGQPLFECAVKHLKTCSEEEGSVGEVLKS